MKETTARGVYLDLNKSPYEYRDSFGNVFKFSSKKKLEMFIEKVWKMEIKFDKEIDKLKQLGYNVNNSYIENKKYIPNNVYIKDMRYK